MKLFIFSLFLLIAVVSTAQPRHPINDENEVPDYELPELLRSRMGKKIRTPKKWEKIRRPELLKMFTQEIYGEIPGEIPITEIIIHEANGEAFNGLARRKQVELVFEKNGKELSFEILLYLPINQVKAPIFLGYNFYGNHSVVDDANIRLTESWVEDNPSLGIIHNQITEQSRGAKADDWPIQKILKAGYGVATIYCGDIDPDWNNFENGIHPLLYKEGQIRPRPNEWGTMAAWAWGLSRTMDYLETDTDVDASKVIAFGHSRLGKAVLWAAAQDERFAMCISNNSGCLGAALSRRKVGETVGRIAYTFPHWYAENLKKYAGIEQEMPVDQHMLLALIAPRPLYVTSATEDLWSDPMGEFLAALNASPAYALYGMEGLPINEMPEANKPVMETIGYHIRKGKHAITDYDWNQFITFANLHQQSQ